MSVQQSPAIDGKATKACCTTTKKVAGKHVITVEGLSDFEKEAFVYGFGVKGAVQCGFCIPGMVIATYYLLSNNSDPTEDEIRLGLSGNICRCTGYDMIVESVRLAAKRGGELWKK